MTYEYYQKDRWELPHDLGDIAVVIPCHNYGRYLAEAINSVLAQDLPAAEILVIDDASDDDTASVARSFADRGVRYIRTENRSEFLSRKTGYDQTTAPVLCFLDADDTLPSNYLSKGMKFFSLDSGIQLGGQEVAVVYSDWQTFGLENNRRTFPNFDAGALMRDNYIHAGSLVLREALEVSEAFLHEPPPLARPDWWVWRTILEGPRWCAVKQPAVYQYRKHGDSFQDACRRRPFSYFEAAGLSAERLTLFVPLAGRWAILDNLNDFLAQQTWPHDQIDLILFNTSHDDAFIDRVENLSALSDYPSHQFQNRTVGDSGIADQNRRIRTVERQVRAAVAQLYRWLVRECWTEYVWILEDDIVPPFDVAEQLMREFTADVASVAAPYRSRYHGDFIVWDEPKRGGHRKPANGTEVVGGNGFGCAILRRSVLRTVNFPDDKNCDEEFYKVIHRKFKSKVVWPAACKHLDGLTGEGI